VKVTMIFDLSILALLCGLSWLFVLSSTTRRNFLRMQWNLFKLNRQQREFDDAVALACSLVFALTFTIVLVFVIGTSLADLAR
jgi:hypothetical protein